MESLDTFRTVSFAADFASERLPPVTVSGGDFKGRVFRLSLTDGGQPTQAEGVQCRLGWNADPGEALGSYVEAARVDGAATATWEVEVPSSMLAQPRCKAAWMFYTAGTANVLCTLAFDVAVERPVVDTGSAEGEDLADRLWTAIDTMGQATDNANAATESAHRAADAAAEAAAKALSQATGNVLASEASGELVNVDDAYPGPLLETKVFGRSEQVTTTGKNLLSNANSVVGKPTATINNAPLTLGAATYTFSFKAVPGSKDIGAGFSLRSASGTLRTIYTSLHSDGLTASATFTVSADEASSMVAYSIAWYSGLLGSTIEAFQLELGSTATAYEPYSGGAPSPSPEWPQPIDSVSSAEVVTAGGNLLDFDEYVTGNAANIDVSDPKRIVLTTYNTGFAFRRYRFRTVPGQTYTFKVKAISQGYITVIRSTGKGYGSINSSNASVQFTAEEDACFVQIVPSESATVGMVQTIEELSVTLGTTVPEWAPGSVATHTLDLQGHELRSLPDGTRDELVVNADGSYGIVQRVGHVVLDGVNFKTAQVFAHGGFERIRVDLPNRRTPSDDFEDSIVSDMFTSTPTRRYSDGYAFLVNSKTYQSVFLYSANEAFAADASADAWLAENRPELDYPLATEAYIPLGTLDPAPSWPDEGVNNAWTVADLPTETGVGYVQSVQVVHDRQEARIAALETAIATLEA